MWKRLWSLRLNSPQKICLWWRSASRTCEIGLPGKIGNGQSSTLGVFSEKEPGNKYNIIQMMYIYILYIHNHMNIYIYIHIYWITTYYYTWFVCMLWIIFRSLDLCILSLCLHNDIKLQSALYMDLRSSDIPWYTEDWCEPSFDIRRCYLLHPGAGWKG